MSKVYQFRQATDSDLPLLQQWTLALMDHEALPQEIELPLKADVDERIRQWIESTVNSDNALYIVAEDEQQKPCGCILGLMQLAPNDFIEHAIQGLIQMVWVIESERRHGLANQLVSHMEQTFKNLEIPFCEISFSVSNDEAKGFWLANNYQPVSQTCRKFL